MRNDLIDINDVADEKRITPPLQRNGRHDDFGLNESASKAKCKTGRAEPRRTPEHNGGDQQRDQAGDQHADQDDKLVTDGAVDLKMCGIDWLWPDRFARGKFGLIAGLPDMGKGQIAAFIAAAVTANVNLPCGEGNATQGNVIWFNAEDGACDTVLPRLVAAGADPKRIHLVKSARVDGKDKTFSLVTDLHLLRKEIERRERPAPWTLPQNLIDEARALADGRIPLPESERVPWDVLIAQAVNWDIPERLAA